MRRSVLLVRMLGVVLLTIAITALTTSVIYTYIARNVFMQIKENELLPRARALSAMLGTYQRRIGGRASLDMLSEVFGTNSEGDLLLGAFVVATDDQGQVILSSQGMHEDYLRVMTVAAQDVLRMGEVRTHQIRALHTSGLVCVGVPITSGAPLARGGKITGALLLLIPLYEAMVAMNSLNGTLIASLLLSLPLVSVLVYFAVGRVVMPLRQMRDVAAGMANGNFEARADDSQRGEIGQLGRSLNHLSRELKHTISALTLERNRLQQTLDGLREGIVAVDEHGNITHMNPAVAQLFMPLREDVEDDRLLLIPDAAVWAVFDAVIAEGEAATRTMTVCDRRVQLSITPLMDDGRVAGAVALFTDVTESERLERTRRDYVANVSHEMRTPLTAMRALLEPLNEGMVMDEAARKRYYTIMLRETMRLSRLIDDLMELSRLQSGTMAISVSPVNLKPLLEEMAGKYAPIAEDHGLAFAMRVDEGCPTVLTNADRVEQVLVILLDNAMKYTPEGGRVSIEVTWDKHLVTMCVRDTGIGIAVEDQPYVFDRFYKVDKAHSETGSGLGLSIASELIAQLGERMWLKSVPNEGSAFYFTLKRDWALPARNPTRVSEGWDS